MKVHERGYFEDMEASSFHKCDEPLCDAITEMYDVETAVDIGCGDGQYTHNLIKAGIACVGFDGSPLTEKVSGGLCDVLDFSIPTDIGQFDLVLCLEVGEHIPAKYEQIFIENLVRASKKHICLSWAVEGQAGWGHVNCRNNDYVVNEFTRRGFTYKEKSSMALRKASQIRRNKTDQEFPWFKNTIMVFEL